MRTRLLMVGAGLLLAVGCQPPVADLVGASCEPGATHPCDDRGELVCSPATRRCVLRTGGGTATGGGSAMGGGTAMGGSCGASFPSIPTTGTVSCAPFNWIGDPFCDGGCTYSYATGVAVDSTGSVYVSGVKRVNGAPPHAVLMVISDQGTKWNTIDEPTDAIEPMKGAPQVTVDGCDNVFFTGVWTDPMTTLSMPIRRRMASEATFTGLTSTFPSAPLPNTNLAVGPDGRLFISGTQGTSADAVTFMSDDHGATWKAMTLVAAQPTGSFVPLVTLVTSRGTVISTGSLNPDSAQSWWTYQFPESSPPVGNGSSDGGHTIPSGGVAVAGGGVFVNTFDSTTPTNAPTPRWWLQKSDDEGSSYQGTRLRDDTESCTATGMAATPFGVFALGNCGTQPTAGHIHASPTGDGADWQEVKPADAGLATQFVQGKSTQFHAVAGHSDGVLYVVGEASDEMGNRIAVVVTTTCTNP